MATIEEIQEMWSHDSRIDENHLDNASIELAKLHSKYINLLINTKLKITKLNYDYNIVRKNKFRWMRGELTRDELKELDWQQWSFNKPLKAEMEEMLTGDEDLAAMKIKIEYLEAMKYLLESILDAIKSLGWNIKNAIAFKQFIAGN